MRQRRFQPKRQQRTFIGAAALAAIALALTPLGMSAASAAPPADADITADDILIQDGSTWRDDWGLLPGDTFRYQYWLTNNGTEPVQLDGFVPNFSTLITNPTVLANVSEDYCDQFFSQVPTDNVQSFPQIIGPGETAGPFMDNAIYFFDTAAGNECQGLTMNFGAPQFHVDQPVDPSPTAPTAPIAVQTAASGDQ